MNKFTSKVAAAALTMTLASVSGQALAADSSKPIVIPTHNWSSQIVMAYVLGGMFESMGNNVEYVPSDSQAVYEAIRNGDITISHEVWQSSMGASFYNAMAKGGLIDAGTHSAATLEDMGVPTWVIDQNLCPGLPNWEALKDCKDVFATTDSEGKGRWLEGPPNFTDSEGFTFIEFPPYFDGCRTVDGGDGSCGSPKGWLKKAANYKFPKTHPAAYTMYAKTSFNATDIGQMAALVDIDGMSAEDAAKAWLAAHEDVWMPFTQ